MAHRSGYSALTLRNLGDCNFNRKFHLWLLPGAELCSLPLLLVGAVLLQEEEGAAPGLCNREDNCLTRQKERVDYIENSAKDVKQ
jgi:hypothetical protein